MRVASRLVGRLAVGRSLSRREHKLLVRVFADIARLVPLSFFVLVPMMEFALPFAIRIFPRLLPSTFEEKHQVEERRIKLLKVRLEMAELLEHTLEERAKQLQEEETSRERKEMAAERARREEELEARLLGGAAGVGLSLVETRMVEMAKLAGGGELASEPQARMPKEVRDFMVSVREGGRRASPDELLSVMRGFKDNVTLDHLYRDQLVAIARFLGMNAFAPTGILRFQIRRRLKKLRADDKEILWEGLDALSERELKEDLRERGLPTKNLDKEAMREALENWLALSQKKEIPYTLLILTNMLHFAEAREDQQAAASEAAMDAAAATASGTAGVQGGMAAAPSAAATVAGGTAAAATAAAATASAEAAAAAAAVLDGGTAAAAGRVNPAAAAAAAAGGEAPRDADGEFNVDAAQAALAALPLNVTSDMRISSADVTDEDRLESLRSEEALIDEERQVQEAALVDRATIDEAIEDAEEYDEEEYDEAADEAAKAKAKAAADEAAKATATAKATADAKVREGAEVVDTAPRSASDAHSAAELLEDKWAAKDKAPLSPAEAEADDHAAAPSSEAKTTLSREQVSEIAEAVDLMAADSAVATEREKMEQLEAKREAKRESIEAAKAKGNSSVRLLDSRVGKMMARLQEELAETETSIGQAFHSWSTSTATASSPRRSSRPRSASSTCRSGPM